MPHPFRLAAASAAVLLAATTVHAQQVQSVRPAAATAPSASARATQAAPNPAGLRAPFPAGLSSGSGAAVSTDPVAAGNAVVPPNSTGNAPGTGTGFGAGGGFAGTGTGSGLAGEGPDTTVMGAGAVGLVSRGPGQSVPLGSSGLNPVEVARAFIRADGNADGELTRGEAQRLGLSTMSFEEMDRDFDGIITRFEYQDGLR